LGKSYGADHDVLARVAEEDGAMNFVMPGLVLACPGHPRPKVLAAEEGVDGRVKPGHDEL
jgi:hypothetical protein